MVLLLCRTLSENSFVGTLPVEWAWTPRFSLLKNLNLDKNPTLSATLPSAWGGNGAFSSLQVCANCLFVRRCLMAHHTCAAGVPGEMVCYDV